MVITAATLLAVVVLSLLRGDLPVLKRLPRWAAPAFHFFAYAVLSFLFVRLLAASIDAPLARALTGCLIAAGVGAIMEFLQRFRPARTARLTDVLLNAAGALLGSLIGVM